MLRFIVLVLLLANGAYYAWSQGMLVTLGAGGPAQQTEPQRIAQQIRPEALRIVGADEARRIETAVPAVSAGKPPECLQAGPVDDKTAEALRTALASWPAGSWSLDPVTEAARWIIYMGKYLTVENVNRKKAELRQIGVSFESLSNPSMELGLSLGGFAGQQAAQQQLDKLAERGVRTARVVQERPEVKGLSLKLPAVDDALRPKLDELRGTLNTVSLRACR